MDQERVPQESEKDSEREQQRRDREFNRAAELSNELQPDLQLTEGPASRGRIVTYWVVILVILGAVIYGLNNAYHRPSNQPPAQTTQTNTSPPQDGSPTGTTTGSATNRPTPPQSGPTGADIDRSSQPPFAGQSK